MGTAIEKQLSDTGYRMLGSDESKEQLILSILMSEDIRYLKAIPFLIYKYDLNLEKIYRKTAKKSIFGKIIAFTRKIFEENNISRPLLYSAGGADLDYKEIEKKYYEEFKEFKQEFELQKANLDKPKLLIEKQEIYAERDLQMRLSQLFTKKEKWIIRRILEEKPISRTDYEYYSRKTKKKLNSIINLQNFARTLYARAPKYDDELFALRKKLERWIEENSKDKGISILKYFIWDSDKLSISYRKEDTRYSEEQIFNTIRKINEIKDRDILNLLDKYKEHDFK